MLKYSHKLYKSPVSKQSPKNETVSDEFCFETKLIHLLLFI